MKINGSKNVPQLTDYGTWQCQPVLLFLSLSLSLSLFVFTTVTI